MLGLVPAPFGAVLYSRHSLFLLYYFRQRALRDPRPRNILSDKDRESARNIFLLFGTEITYGGLKSMKYRWLAGWVAGWMGQSPYSTAPRTSGQAQAIPLCGDQHINVAPANSTGLARPGNSTSRRFRPHGPLDLAP